MAIRAMRQRQANRALEQKRQSLIDFACHVDPSYVADPAHILIAETLEKVLSGKIRRLIITAPPQIGKSRLVSEIFPAFWFAHNKGDSIILSSYSDTLAHNKGFRARDIIKSSEFQELYPEIKLRQDRHAANDWEIAAPHQGEFYSCGVGGSVTGRGAALGIIDDPVKDWEEAQSDAVRNATWDWWQATFRTRIREGGAVILIMTRWHRDDLGGKFIRDYGDNWTVLRLTALGKTQIERDAENKLLGFTAGLPDPLNREPDESLCPRRFSAKTFQETREEIGATKYAALYDGAPSSPEGEKIKRHWFEIVEFSPFDAKYRVRYWDPAATKRKNSKYTAGVRIAEKDGIYYIEHVTRGKWESHERNNQMLQTAKAEEGQYGKFKVEEIWEEEGGSSGRDASMAFYELFAGFVAKEDRADKNKDVRLEAFVAAAGSNRVKLVMGAWNESYLDELTQVPNSDIRDQVDATAGAFNWIEKKKASVKQSYFAIGARTEAEVMGR